MDFEWTYTLYFKSLLLLHVCRTLDNLDKKPLTVTRSAVLLDIEIRCSDGSMQASSQLLAVHSVVFERMLFASTAMSERLSGVVNIDDATVADITLIIKLYMPLEDHVKMLGFTSRDGIFQLMRVVHSLEFAYALRLIIKRLLDLAPVPTAQELQQVMDYCVCVNLRVCNNLKYLPIHSR